VIAAVRDPSNSTSKSLSSLPVGKGSALITIPLDASSETSITNAIHTLTTQYSITSLSVVIANAGMVEFYGTVLQTPVQGARDHYNTNVIGALALFQEVYPLLQSSAKVCHRYKYGGEYWCDGGLADESYGVW
jgi:norsolorinic acid ketoreductase